MKYIEYTAILAAIIGGLFNKWNLPGADLILILGLGSLIAIYGLAGSIFFKIQEKRGETIPFVVVSSISLAIGVLSLLFSHMNWDFRVLLAIAAYIVLPIVKWSFLPWLGGFLLLHATMGLTLSIVFQLAHVVENTEFEHVALEETKHVESAWAVHELKTTSNFAMGSKIISWFVGGLNFQIEHHLFPKVSHVHYPAIADIVKKVCSKHHLHYIEFKTMNAAIASHFKMMKRLGKRPAGMA